MPSPRCLPSPLPHSPLWEAEPPPTPGLSPYNRLPLRLRKYRLLVILWSRLTARLLCEARSNRSACTSAPLPSGPFSPPCHSQVARPAQARLCPVALSFPCRSRIARPALPSGPFFPLLLPGRSACASAPLPSGPFVPLRRSQMLLTVTSFQSCSRKCESMAAGNVAYCFVFAPNTQSEFHMEVLHD